MGMSMMHPSCNPRMYHYNRLPRMRDRDSLMSMWIVLSVLMMNCDILRICGSLFRDYSLFCYCHRRMSMMHLSCDPRMHHLDHLPRMTYRDSLITMLSILSVLMMHFDTLRICGGFFLDYLVTHQS